MKKEIILKGMAWGHLPRFMIEEELRHGQLLPIVGRHLPGKTEQLAVARRRDRPHGPVANQLWEHLQEQAPDLQATMRPPRLRRRRLADAARSRRR